MRHAAATRFASLMAVVSMIGAAGTALAQDATTPLAADTCAGLQGLIGSLTALRNWVEKNQAPAGLTATDGNPNANRSRPLCEWPTWPKFTGAAGSEGSAASFTCVDP
jgi:hypothetical protein